jgi:hypothetical protein
MTKTFRELLAEHQAETSLAKQHFAYINQFEENGFTPSTVIPSVSIPVKAPNYYPGSGPNYGGEQFYTIPGSGIVFTQLAKNKLEKDPNAALVQSEGKGLVNVPYAFTRPKAHAAFADKLKKRAPGVKDEDIERYWTAEHPAEKFPAWDVYWFRSDLPADGFTPNHNGELAVTAAKTVVSLAGYSNLAIGWAATAFAGFVDQVTSYEGSDTRFAPFRIDAGIVHSENPPHGLREGRDYYWEYGGWKYSGEYVSRHGTLKKKTLSSPLRSARAKASAFLPIWTKRKNLSSVCAHPQRRTSSPQLALVDSSRRPKGSFKTFFPESQGSFR